jgi:hypothetical protein
MSGPMYLRTGNIFKNFTVQQKNEDTTARGRVTASFDKGSGTQLRAVLADATPDEKERWKQNQHPITHILTQQGKPLATEGDRLLLGRRIFYVQGVDDPGGLELWTLYYVEERVDTRGN